MQEELLSLVYSRWKLHQVHSTIPSLRVEKLTKMAFLSKLCSWMPDEVILHVKDLEDALSLAELLPCLGSRVKTVLPGLRPVFALRFLELSEEEFVYYTEQNSAQRKKLSYMYPLKALSLGYNGFLLRTGERQLFSDQYIHFYRELIWAFRSYNVRLGVDISFFRHESRHELQRFLGHVEADFIFHDCIEELFLDAEGLLPHESLLEGVIWLRQMVREDLLMILKINSLCFWEGALIHLLSVFPENSLLAFDAHILANGTFSPHAIHPLWNFLQKDILDGNLPLVPLFWGGLSGYGSGSWPVFLGREWDDLLRLSKKLRLQAIGVMSERLPQGHGFLECSLWCLGYACWVDVPLSVLYNCWSTSYQMNDCWSLEWIDLVTMLVKCVMASHSIKKDGEGYGSRNWIHRTFSFMAKHASKDGRLQVYIRYFIEDMEQLFVREWSTYTFQEKQKAIANLHSKRLNKADPFSEYVLLMQENGYKLVC